MLDSPTLLKCAAFQYIVAQMLTKMFRGTGKTNDGLKPVALLTIKSQKDDVG